MVLIIKVNFFIVSPYVKMPEGFGGELCTGKDAVCRFSDDVGDL